MIAGLASIGSVMYSPRTSTASSSVADDGAAACSVAGACGSACACWASALAGASRAEIARNRYVRAEVSFMDGSLSLGSERLTSQCCGRTAALTKGRCSGLWHRSPAGNEDAFTGSFMANGAAGQPPSAAPPHGAVGSIHRTDVVDVRDERDA